jgi:hypothetical protein
MSASALQFWDEDASRWSRPAHNSHRHRQRFMATPPIKQFEYVDAWNRFKQHIDGLDAAVDNPFAPGAAQLLCRADRLVGIDADKLAGWLIHIGEALTHD